MMNLTHVRASLRENCKQGCRPETLCSFQDLEINEPNVTDENQKHQILVATDLNARSDRAIDRALFLAEILGTRTTVCHAVAPESMQALDQSKLREMVRSVLPDPDADVDIVLPSGPAPETIAKVASELNPLFIVMGVGRYNSVGDYFLGTTVDHVVRRASVPVLIVKHRPHKPYWRILCAVDFSAHSAKALLAALRLFPQARVIVIHAYHVPFESWNKADYVREEVAANALRELEAFLNDQPISATDRKRLEYRTGYGDVSSALKKEMDSEEFDLVVFGTHGMSGFRYATLGSVASSLLQWVVPDTLVVPPKWREMA